MGRRVARLAGLHLLVGATVAACVFMLRGKSLYSDLGWATSQWPGSPRPLSAILLHAPVVAVTYCLREWMLALVEGVVLAALVRWRASRVAIVTVGVAVAVIFEVFLKLPLRHGWMATIAAWWRPDLEWAMPYHHPSRGWSEFVKYEHPVLIASLVVSLYAAGAWGQGAPSIAGSGEGERDEPSDGRA